MSGLFGGQVREILVELGIAAYGHLFGICAQEEDAPGIQVRLHQAAIHMGEHPPIKPAGASAFPEAFVGESPVDHQGWYLLLTGKIEEIGPQLGLHKQKQMGANRAQGPSGREGQIEGHVEEALDIGDGFARHGLTGRGDGGKDEPGLGKPLFQGSHNGLRGGNLSHRDGVDPDAQPLPFQRGNEAQTLPESGPRFASDQADQKIDEQQWDAEEQSYIIQQVDEPILAVGGVKFHESRR